MPAYPSKIAIPKMIIRYKGLFDFDGLYSFMVRWLKTHRYEFYEYDYKHKVPSPYGAEQEIGWRAEQKVTEYYKYTISIYSHLWDMTEVEVVQKGVKKTLTNARIEITFDGTIDIDYEKRFAQSTFWITIRDWWHRYVRKEEIETLWHDELYYRVQKLHEAVKEYLDMQARGSEYKGYLGDNV